MEQLLDALGGTADTATLVMVYFLATMKTDLKNAIGRVNVLRKRVRTLELREARRRGIPLSEMSEET